MVTTIMARHLMLTRLAAVFAMVISLAPSGRAQDQPSGNSRAPSSSRQAQTPDRREGFGRVAQGSGRPLFGKISAIHNEGIEITTREGNKVLVNLDAKTEFRKERQPAKIGDFKVGDAVIVRTDQASGNSTGATAIMVAAVPPAFAGRGGAGGPGGMSGRMVGTLGKDYLLGEVKSLDPPKMTILRTDNVTQTIELNEETSLRRGLDSITMVDIQPGDHVFVRGATASDVFVPKGLNVIPPEQWKRMQEKSEGHGAAPQNATPIAPAGSPQPQTPPEQRN